MELNSLFAGGAVVGILTALWSKIKLMASKLNSVFFVTVVIQSYPVNMALKIYLLSEFKCSRFTKNYVGSRTEFIKPLKRMRNVGFELIPTEPTLWWYKKRPILLSVGQDTVTLTYLRGTFNFKKIIENALNKLNFTALEEDKKTTRFFIIKENGTLGESKSEGLATSNRDREKSSSEPSGNWGGISSKYEGKPIHWSIEELGLPKSDNALSALALSPDILNAVDEAKRWKRSEDWFKLRSVPWKRGWLLWGEPGTGKTAFVRALAQELDMPVIVFNLATMSNSDFIRSWERAMNYLPAIFLFEDLDNIFDGRENKCSTSMAKGVSFDIFINTLDGIDTTDGVFLVVTTNNLKSIDPALGNVDKNMSTRPGRIDRTLEFKKLTNNGRIKIASRIFEGIDEHHWKVLLEDGKDDTGAQFQFRCSTLASKLWEEMKYE